MTTQQDPDEAAFAQEHPRAYAAIGYAQRGWRVLPVHWISFGRCTCLAGGQAACASAGKHPLENDWPDTATTDLQEIVMVWGQSPDANVGIATGSTSGIFVIDVDEGVRADGTYKQGLESLIDLQDTYDDLPETYAVQTGGGGCQHYFAMPEGYTIKNAVKAFGDEYPDIDIRGDGGMVVAPPSVSGRGPYIVDTDGDVAEAPQWMLDLLLQRGVMEPHERPRDPSPAPMHEAAPVVHQTPAPDWLEASIAAKLEAVRSAPDGAGNTTINRMSYMIGQYIPHGWITFEDAQARLSAAAATWAHPHPQAEFTIRHGLTDGQRAPYQSLDQVAATGDLSDAIVSERVAGELLAGRFCWVFGMDWMAWNGQVWDLAPDVQVIETIRRHLITEVRAALPAAANNANARRSLAGLLSKSRINAIMLLTRGVLQVDSGIFDRHPDLLNTPSGVVDLRTGDVSEHDPYLYMTKITHVGYRPGARHDDWDAALEAVPADVRSWVQYRMGQSLTGYTPPDDSMILMQGTGANGKTTFTNTVASVIGNYYAVVPSSAMIGKQEDPHALMAFWGARLAVVEELPEGRRLNVTRLKETVGTPKMTGRYMYKNPVTWDATHQLVITTNYIPTVSETDGGTWRRLRMVTFPYRFVRPGKPLETENDRRGDPQLRYRLASGTEQQEACLAWLVEGAMSWYAHDKAIPEDPERIMADTDDWRGQADLILSACWRELLEADTTRHVLADDLFDAFNKIIDGMGHVKWSKQTFAMRFGQHEVTLKHRAHKSQLRKNDGLSLPKCWPPKTIEDTPDRYMAWLGVKFKGSE